MITIQELQKFPLFACLDQKTCQALSHRTFEQTLKAGQTLVIEGMPAEFCYFLLSGEVRVIRMSIEGRIQVLARLGAGAPINIVSLLLNKKINQATVETLTPVTVFTLDSGDFLSLIEGYPDFSTMLLQTFAERMTKITDLAAGLSLYTVRARLAQFLIELADLPQTPCGWTQDEIAAHIGTVRDVVGRLLREFEAEGLIKRNRQQIQLLDRKGLTLETENNHH